MTTSEVRDVELPALQPLRQVREAFDRSVAVALGINGYGHGIPQLRTAVPDVEAVAALLESDHGFTTVLRRDAEVTSNSVRALFEHELRDLLGGPLGERDRLLVYFAGHGLAVPSEHGPEGQLLFADADPANPVSWFAMSELRRLIGALPCRHMLIVLDCCFAGAFRWAGRRNERALEVRWYRETLDRFVNHRAWQVLVSASHDQTALDVITSRGGTGPVALGMVDLLRTGRIESERHSPFAAAFVRGLKGEADYTKDGLIVASELELFVRDTVERLTRVQQTPQLYKLDEHDRGEFVFQVPGATLELGPAPALSIAACPYLGFQSYSAAERDRFVGRAQAVVDIVERVKTRPLTVIVGPSGTGKSSLLAAGIVPALREITDWTVVEARADEMPDETLRDAIPVSSSGGPDPGTTLFERITAWFAAHAGGRLCLAIDHAEAFEMRVAPVVPPRVLGDLARALVVHGGRLRIVLTLCWELEQVFRTSALQPFWKEGALLMPPLAQHELREIIQRLAHTVELSFEPPGLVDTLINDVLHAPGALALLAFLLRDLYVRCVKRNSDRLLTEDDYASMGRIRGALAQRAAQLLDELVARDPAYQATARRVFLRMIGDGGGDRIHRGVEREELVFLDDAENQRVAALLQAFQRARLVVFDGDAWKLAHDGLVHGWPRLATWQGELAATALALQSDLA